MVSASAHFFCSTSTRARFARPTKVRAVLDEPPVNLSSVALEVTLAAVDGRPEVLLGSLQLPSLPN
jgi:hypothetical protein